MTQLETNSNVDVNNLLHIKGFDENEFRIQLAEIVGEHNVDKTMEVLKNPYGEKKLKQLQQMEGWKDTKKFWRMITAGGLGTGCIAASVLTVQVIKHIVTSPALLIAGKYAVVVLQAMCLVGQWYMLNKLKDEIAKATNEDLGWMQKVDGVKSRLYSELKVARVNSDVKKVNGDVLKELLQDIRRIRQGVEKQLSEIKLKKNLRRAFTVGAVALGVVGVGVGVACLFFPFGQVLGCGILISVCGTLAVAGVATEVYATCKYEKKFKEITLKYEQLVNKILIIEGLLVLFTDCLDLLNAKRMELRVFFDRTDLKEVAADDYDAWINELVQQRVLTTGNRLLNMDENHFYSRLENSQILQKPDKKDIWQTITEIQRKYQNAKNVMIHMANKEN